MVGFFICIFTNMKRACQILTLKGIINSEHHVLPLKNKL